MVLYQILSNDVMIGFVKVCKIAFEDALIVVWLVALTAKHVAAINGDHGSFSSNSEFSNSNVLKQLVKV